MKIKRISFLLLLIIIISLKIRLSYITDQKLNNPLFFHPVMDAKIHYYWGQNLFENYPLSKPPFFRSPVYPLVLRIIINVLGNNIIYLKLFNIILGILNIFLLYYICILIFKNKFISYIAALLYSLYWPFIYFEGELLLETLFIFSILISHYVLLNAIKKKLNYLFIISGFLFGFSAIIRPNVLIVIPVYIFIFIKYHIPKKSIVYYIIFFAIAILPVTLVNYIYGNDFVLISSQAGINFYIGNNQQSDGVSAIYPEGREDWWGGYEDSFKFPEKIMHKKLKPSEVSRFWIKRCIRQIIDNPLHWLKLLFNKTVLLVNNFELSNNQSIYYFKNLSKIMHYPLINFGIIFSLSITGLIFFISNNKNIYLSLIAGFILFYSIGVIIFFINSRYRLPIVPFLIIFASLCINNIINYIKDKKYNKLLIAIILIISFSYLSFKNWCQIKPHPYRHYITMADIYRENKNYKIAIYYYLKAISINPDKNPAWINLAVSYMELKKYYRAKNILYKAMEYCPKDYQVYTNLGTVMYNLSKYSDSLIMFKRALKLYPDSEYAKSYLKLLKDKDLR